MTTAGQGAFTEAAAWGSSALALLDLSSLAPRIRVAADVVDALELTRDLLDRVVVPPRSGREIIDVDLRIYGGFFAHDGTSTAQYTFLLRSARYIQGLLNGLRIQPTIAVSLACRPSARIIGTFRDGRQRMVDQMLAQDAVFLAPKYDLVGVISDDEDYFPAILTLAVRNEAPVRWVRQRELGRNDNHLQSTRVTTFVDSTW